MIVLLNEKQNFKINSFHNKIAQQIIYVKMYLPQYYKGHYDKLTSNIIFRGSNLK